MTPERMDAFRALALLCEESVKAWKKADDRAFTQLTKQELQKIERESEE